MSLALTGPADLRDQKWLDEQVATLGDGIEAARNIWTNWHEGRNVGRLHPGLSAGEYIGSLGLRLTMAEAMAALPDGSTRQIAAVAGVGTMTVQDARVRNRTPDDSPARVTGADGKSYPARVVREVVAQVLEEGAVIEQDRTYPAYWADLARLMDLIEGLSANVDAPSIAATVPSRRRAATARRLRKLGTYLGGIAWSLESNGEIS